MSAFARGSQRGTIAAMVVAFLLAAVLYVQTAAPSVQWGDSGEFQTVALVGGIPHATGYPLFLLLGSAFAHLPAADPAFRVTLLSCFFGAASLALFVLVAVELGVGPVAALCAAAVYGLSFSFWRVSIRAEVYTLAIFLGLLALLATLVALRRGRLADALVAGFLMGLSLVGHLCFAAPVAVMGAFVAWRQARFRRRPWLALALLLGAFLLGLVPYLYILWLDGRPLALDYYEQVMQVKNPLGLPRPDFDTAGERLVWLLTGRNHYPPVPLGIDARAFAVRLAQSGFIVALFEFGPVATALGFAGARRLLGLDRARALLLALVFVSSVVYSSATQSGAILALFLLPACTVMALLVGLGLEARWSAWPALGGGLARPAIAVALLSTIVLSNQGIRLWTNVHPIGPWRLRIEEEDVLNHSTTFFPHMRGFRAPQRFGEEAMTAIPRDALVLAHWPEFNVLRYRRLVLGDRPDLALQLMTPETLPLRLALWQREHDVARRPFVFMRRIREMEAHYSGLDSLRLGDGRWIYVQREPIRGAGNFQEGS